MNAALVICVLGAALCYVSGQTDSPVQNITSISTAQDLSSNTTTACDCSSCESTPPPEGNIDFSVCSMEVEACVLKHTSVTEMLKGSLSRIQRQCFEPFGKCTQGIFKNMLQKFSQNSAGSTAGTGTTKTPEGNRRFNFPRF